MNYQNHIFLYNSDKNFEDLVVDSILYPKTFLNLIQNDIYYDRIKHNYGVEDHQIDVLAAFVEKFKKNFFNLLYHVDYIGEKVHDFDHGDFSKLFVEVVKDFIENNLINMKDVLRNIHMAIKEKELFEFFIEEIKNLLSFILDNMRKNTYSLNEDEKNMLKDIFDLIKSSEMREEFDILLSKFQRLVR